GRGGAAPVGGVAGGGVRTFGVGARGAGLPAAPNAALRVDSVAESAARVRGVLAGEPGPARDIVCLNAAAGLVVAGVVVDLVEGVGRAQRAIDSGAAATTLEHLARFTRRGRTAEAAG